MTESSHPRLPRRAHSVLQPGNASRPGGLMPGAPVDIDVAQAARDTARHGRTPRARSGPVRRRSDALVAGTGAPVGEHPGTVCPAAHGAPRASGSTAAEVLADRTVPS
ncbi:hypothetical protein ACFXAE_15535 [Streptomyces sp. NPDC059454]|uniref:hypothetical protein n=1 Tax=Streptomyces sp. NPDC059454 TaxID=3346836 RepID=UPI0036BE946D